MVTIGDLINFFKALFEDAPGILEAFGKLLALFGIEIGGEKKEETAE